MQHYKNLVKLRESFFKEEDLNEEGISGYNSTAGEFVERHFEEYVKEKASETYEYMAEYDIGVYYICLCFPEMDAKELNEGDKTTRKSLEDENRHITGKKRERAKEKEKEEKKKKRKTE